VGKNKLSKFAEMQSFSNVLQVTFSQLEQYDHPMNRKEPRLFHNQKPIVLSWVVAKANILQGLAEANPENNYIGIDIKGGANVERSKYATDNQLFNVGFLRTHIEMVDRFFSLGEVMKSGSLFPILNEEVRKRLTSTRFY
jgi:tRNA (guanine-N7-)-methyltransferase